MWLRELYNVEHALMSATGVHSSPQRELKMSSSIAPSSTNILWVDFVGHARRRGATPISPSVDAETKGRSAETFRGIAETAVHTAPLTTLAVTAVAGLIIGAIWKL